MRRRFMLSRSKIEPLFFEALENGFYFTFTHECEYCLNDDYEWVTLSANTMSPTINIGEKIYVRANRLPSTMTGVGTFGITKSCNLGGNPISLVASNQLLEKSFQDLFSNCSGIIDASQLQLPATTLVSDCYRSMFYGCTSLTTAPKLPATTLATSCYRYMFYGCSSLTTAPELPATTLANNCYCYMFQGCTSLTTAPELPATTLANSCYSRMFYGCTALTTAPELSATTLVSDCYYNMFYGCKKLNYIKMLATDISATGCLSIWVSDVSSTGTFVKNPNMTSLPTGDSGIPSGWTVVDDGEE